VRRRSPRPLVVALAETVGRLSPDGEGDRLLSGWREVAAQLPTAAGATPVGLRSGELVVEVADGLLKAELAFQQAELLAAAQAAFGESLVSRVVLKLKG